MIRRPKLKVNRYHQNQQTKAQSFKDEGRPINLVDENLSVLKKRIEMMKVKERLERCCKRENGWNYGYGPVYDENRLMIRKREMLVSNLVALTGLVCETVGFTCVSGTVLLFLVSLFVHIYR
ncbi:TGF-beta-activated kinase 1 and MAP3K7-binding protein like [Quillaja saponaria]|uniref:TGF-beta-activated kinase 1 and MAP3K7-binding protein like n=1 Tax=Quillaja saponaria TaxID=32244 RepID=A0AAD7VCW6_QUISA|nr:TGF-beta-activated kinase 1 and MAP3K7-binding protein like [Quillaja saponaria]